MDSRLRQALRLVFLPLANLLLKNRVDLAPVVEQLKIAYIEAARRNHGRVGKPASVNKISKLTGMSRNYVSNLVSQLERAPDFGDLGRCLESSILGKWASSEEYLDHLGRPRPLKPGPGEGSFHELVARSVPDNEVDAVMADLLSLDNVVKRPDGNIELSDRIFLITTDLPRLLTVCLAPIVDTLDKNWDKSFDNRFGARVAHSDQVGSHSISRIRGMSKQRISKFMEEFDDLLYSLEVEDNEEMQSPEGQKLLRIGVGAYYFETDA